MQKLSAMQQDIQSLTDAWLDLMRTHVDASLAPKLFLVIGSFAHDSDDTYSDLDIACIVEAYSPTDHLSARRRQSWATMQAWKRIGCATPHPNFFLLTPRDIRDLRDDPTRGCMGWVVSSGEAYQLASGFRDRYG